MYVRSTVIYQRRERDRERESESLYSTVLEYVHREFLSESLLLWEFGRATMLLARVNGEPEISLQPVAQV